MFIYIVKQDGRRLSLDDTRNRIAEGHFGTSVDLKVGVNCIIKVEP